MTEFNPQGYQNLSREDCNQMMKMAISSDPQSIFQKFATEILKGFKERIQFNPTPILGIKFLKDILNCPLREAHKLGSALMIAMPAVLYPEGLGDIRSTFRALSERYPEVFSFIVQQQLTVGQRLVEDAIVSIVQWNTVKQEAVDSPSRFIE